MHNVVWGCTEILHYILFGYLLNYDLVDEGLTLETSPFLPFTVAIYVFNSVVNTKLPTMILILLVSSL